MLRTTELEYDLPESALAKAPVEPRDSAKLMVVRRSEASQIEHVTVRDMPAFLRGAGLAAGHEHAADLLVRNTTRVLPARLIGIREDTGGKVGGLFLREQPRVEGTVADSKQWVVLLQGKSLREGVTVLLSKPSNVSGLPLVESVRLNLICRMEEELGGWLVQVVCTGGLPQLTTELILGQIGFTPLPPYILKARRDEGLQVDEAYDRDRYQTIFANATGSVAAPTASLHFTPQLFDSIEAKGVGVADVVLHVGTGTFRTVETEFVEQHDMHTEWCEMSPLVAQHIRQTRSAKGRVICLGTTAARTVESFAQRPDLFSNNQGVSQQFQGDEPRAMETKILITPGYQWQWTDGLLTNFHLPRSTLLAMVGAMLPGGVPRVKELYKIALSKGYRFFSYGDAMLILP